MSGGDSSDSSDADPHEEDNEIVYTPSNAKTSPSPPLSSPSTAITTTVVAATTASISTASTNTTAAVAATSKVTTQPSIISPLVYHTPQGMMYATPSNGGVILSLAQSDPNAGHPQFITIPFSMVAANGQGELDLSKRK